ncbi:hypothetical protein BC30090_p61 (plasmid) [Bacillus cereus]|nr:MULTISPECIES: tyrosine-type recombinase/integrase [Bacilli]MDA3673974.1 tyrosine-type recombinase/integrase [Streptococcus thermophilus]BCD26951.1 hypothetical protein BC30090_p61 [Bacillus cereus]CJV63787.1 site-specific tyrosine recombinase XerD [Streptococcus pneumoniae]
MSKITQHIGMKIDQVYGKVKTDKLTFDDKNKNKKQLSDRTINTYCGIVKSYNNWLEKTHGISVDRAKPRHAMEYLETKIQAYEKGNGSAFSMRQLAHALHSFREASHKTGVFKHQCKVADKNKMLGTLTERGIFRKAGDSTSLKANHNDYEKVQKEADKSNTNRHLKQEIKTVHELQRYCGMRVHEAVKLKVKDIDLANGTVYIKGKGGHERTVKIENKELLDKLKDLCKGKNANSQVIIARKKDGNQLTNSEFGKRVKQEIRGAAEKAGVDRNGKKYTTHSGRKAYAQAQMDKYKSYSKTQLKKEMAKRCQDKKTKNKYDKVLETIRKKITEGSENKERKLTHKEMCQFLVSLDLGHYRLDVIRYYADY